MVEKILGLLSAFTLGVMAGFFLFVQAIKYAIKHIPESRRELRRICDRYEPQYLFNEPLEPVQDLMHWVGGFSIERGMRGVTGRCVQCGSAEDVRQEILQPLCRSCAKTYWQIPP